MVVSKAYRRQRIKRRIRKKISGTTACPRISIFRSNKYIYAQIVDDTKGHTLVSASSTEQSIASQTITKSEASKLTGKLLGERAKAAGLSQVVFDRGGYLYHGRVQSLAEGAREAGLNF
ncbi:MAG: 50S ribosomal protein L18 [Chitinophagales bacterium]|jgi:large subunit ribosomal protein L18|nr:50S ribosomal protein L18 [Chitinophagales bacterium]HNI43474.1 50S ribosomal protein L18 [Chitinophagales bacterium]HNL07301.1 50S ribosomal protein L18 [Chitinophagales bacterium]